MPWQRGREGRRANSTQNCLSSGFPRKRRFLLHKGGSLLVPSEFPGGIFLYKRQILRITHDTALRTVQSKRTHPLARSKVSQYYRKKEAAATAKPLGFFRAISQRLLIFHVQNQSTRPKAIVGGCWKTVLLRDILPPLFGFPRSAGFL